MGELLTQEFFAPADTDLIDTLIGQYRGERAQIERVCEALHGDGLASVMHYFLTGNSDRHTVAEAWICPGSRWCGADPTTTSSPARPCRW